MSQIHDVIGHFYVQRVWYRDRHAPLVDTAPTQEIEYPYRFGVSRVFRVPLSRTALVVGKWLGERGEEDALLSAVDGREVGYR